MTRRARRRRPPCHAPAAPATSWTRIASATIETKNDRSVASCRSRLGTDAVVHVETDERGEDEEAEAGHRADCERQERAEAPAEASAADRPGRGMPRARRAGRGGRTRRRTGRGRAVRAQARSTASCAITSSSPSITNCQTRSGTAQTCASTCWCSSGRRGARDRQAGSRSSRTVEKMAVNEVSAMPPMSRPAVCASTRPPAAERSKPPGGARPDPGDDEDEAGDEHRRPRRGRRCCRAPAPACPPV